MYLAAIERLKATISTELNRDTPEALDAVLKEAAEKYPGLGGLDSVRQDLRQYLEIRRKSRARQVRAGSFALLPKARFATPLFQDQVSRAGGERPVSARGSRPEVRSRHQGLEEGDAARRSPACSRWRRVPGRPRSRESSSAGKAVMAQFAALQQSRAARSGYAEQPAGVYGSLDPDEDVHFARATQADLDSATRTRRSRGRRIAMNRARRGCGRTIGDQGAIEAAQRSRDRDHRTRSAPGPACCRTRSSSAQQAMQIYAQLGAAAPAQLAQSTDEIKAEAQQQRSALLELRNVLAPALAEEQACTARRPER